MPQIISTATEFYNIYIQIASLISIPPDQWKTQDVPHLRIIGQDLWDKVQQGLTRREGGVPAQHRRAKHMLSGIGVCGVCGGSWNIRTANFWGCGSRNEEAVAPTTAQSRPEITSRVF